MKYCAKCSTRYLSNSGLCPLCKGKGDDYNGK